MVFKGGDTYFNGFTYCGNVAFLTAVLEIATKKRNAQPVTTT